MQANYNRVPTALGEFDYNSIEDLLAKEIETPGVAAVRRYVRTGSCSATDRIHIARFIALQIARVPVFRRGVKELARASVMQAIKSMDRRGLLPEIPAALATHGSNLSDLIENGSVILDILPHYSLTGLISIDSTAEYLTRMNWCLLRSLDPQYFLISDNPVAIYNEDFKHGTSGIGIGYANIELTFPLDVCHCLFAAWKPIERGKVEVAPRSVREINRRIAIFGDRFYAYPIYSDGIKTLAEKYYGGAPSAQVEVIPRPDNKGSYILHSVDFPSEFLRNAYTTRLAPLYPLIR